MNGSGDHPVEAAGPGRPRDPQVDRSVLDATIALLVESGYQKTTIQAIARRAKVSAPAIYRRWATREMIIEDAIFGLESMGDVPLPRSPTTSTPTCWPGRAVFSSAPRTRPPAPRYPG
ncbi:bacterial regulatory, tetR family protein [Rhodococcus sp. MTM3W5.2]|uniref:TetR/AcrR family transcriptional regulator n=1 Tax=Rhodococcus sp. MTM3W5.2 TaxID=1805827 RepID=UPI0009796475|nr:helix-turn-helix domain-containing protein [Rhodococcus sp. MTM3W5.2]AQA26052.1 bacterial regulatory, tetR family protein [Rhodococcus sp. MTM3W5.2]